MNKILPFFNLIRWSNLVLLALNLLIIKLFLINESTNINSVFSDYIFLRMTVSIIFITAAGYIINDYYDIEIDKINKPDKVIICKYFSKKAAIISCITFNVVGILLVIHEPKWLVMMFMTTVFLLWWYSNKLKGLMIIGNLLVSFLTALPLVALAFYYEKNQNIIFMYAYFAFGISLIREIVKDLEDVDGDKLLGLKTSAIVWQIPKSILHLSRFSLGYFLSFMVLIFLLSANYIYLLILFLPIFGFFYSKLMESKSKPDFNYLSKILKLIMLIGVISMIFVK